MNWWLNGEHRYPAKHQATNREDLSLCLCSFVCVPFAPLFVCYHLRIFVQVPPNWWFGLVDVRCYLVPFPFGFNRRGSSPNPNHQLGGFERAGLRVNGTPSPNHRFGSKPPFLKEAETGMRIGMTRINHALWFPLFGTSHVSYLWHQQAVESAKQKMVDGQYSEP